MSLETNALALAIKIGEDVKELKDSMGDLNQLQTADKSSLAGALAEVQQAYADLTTPQA